MYIYIYIYKYTCICPLPLSHTVKPPKMHLHGFSLKTVSYYAHPPPDSLTDRREGAGKRGGGCALAATASKVGSSVQREAAQLHFKPLDCVA